MYRQNYVFLVIGSLLAGLVSVAATAGPTAVAGTSDANTAPVPRSTSQPALDSAARQTLEAMDNTATDGYPDQFGEFAAMKAYSEGRYQSALKWFKYSARYADKLSQLSIGLMYANGLGVAKDPVTACAWLAIAAERNFPKYVATRDSVCSTLSQAELDQAQGKAEALLPIYGDYAAKPLMADALRRIKIKKTGSHLGFGVGVNVVSQDALAVTHVDHYFKFSDSSIRPTRNNCLAPTVGGSRVEGCGDAHYYSPDKVDAQQYFATRNRLWSNGTVNVGPLKQISAPASGKKSTSSPPSKPAPH